MGFWKNVGFSEECGIFKKMWNFRKNVGFSEKYGNVNVPEGKKCGIFVIPFPFTLTWSFCSKVVYRRQSLSLAKASDPLPSEGVVTSW